MRDVTKIISSEIDFSDVFGVDLLGDSIILDGLSIRQSLDAFGEPVRGETYKFDSDSFSASDAFGDRFDIADI